MKVWKITIAIIIFIKPYCTHFTKMTLKFTDLFFLILGKLALWGTLGFIGSFVNIHPLVVTGCVLHYVFKGFTQACFLLRPFLFRFFFKDTYLFLHTMITFWHHFMLVQELVFTELVLILSENVLRRNPLV